MYTFYIRDSKKMESIGGVGAPSRLQAAIFFAKQKRLKLKEFLKIYAISQ